MRNRSLLFLFFLILGCRALAADTIDTSSIKKLYGILLHRQAAPAAGESRWPHRAILYNALHIDPTMSDSVIAARMQLGWQQLADVRASEATEPPVYFYQLLTVALHEHYGAFLLDASRWKVDLNYMDRNTRQTLLDYLEEEYRNNASTTHAEWLREYKQVLVAAGAKYFFELDFSMRRLAARYNKVRPPLYGLYPVQQKGRWGWVDAKGKMVVPLRYKAVRHFTAQLFEVSEGKDFYFINRGGKKQTYARQRVVK
jgi:hypothetical protein